MNKRKVIDRPRVRARGLDVDGVYSCECSPLRPRGRTCARTRTAAVSSKPPYQENEDGRTVTLNVNVVPGLYYAAASAATLEALKRPSAIEPAKAGDAVVVSKQDGSQGFYKVWVSDAPIMAE